MPDLPRGAVTFLFTDIEGSTRLVKQLRDRYHEVLAAHQRLLREAFVHHGGHEVDTQGDAFFVAFANARDAVLAAVEGQRALAAHAWPEGAAVKVRMGVHTGQASPADGRYTGVAVHRAARIGAAGYGGQVLVSQATHTLLEDEEDDLGIEFRDLGSQPLKGLDRPVHLYQVAAPGLATRFPPLRGEDDPKAVAVARPRHSLRRPWFLLAAGALLLIGAALAAVLLSRGGGSGGLSLVHPNNVGVIDPKTNRIVAEVPVGIRPGPIAAGEGSAWVGSIDDRTLTRVNTQTFANAGTVTLDNETPTGIAVGPGAVWVAHGLLGKLSRVDPQFNQVTKTLDLAGRDPSGDGVVAVGGDSVWAAYGDATLARVDPVEGRVRGRGLTASPTGIVYAVGSVWVANRGEQTVSRFSPGTFEAGPVKVTSVGEGPQAVAFGDGAIWVANRDDTVTRVDPDTYATATIPVGHGPAAIAFGEDAVWVAETGGTVSRIDPATRTVTKTIHVGNAPSGIAVANGLVWVTVQAP